MPSRHIINTVLNRPIGPTRSAVRLASQATQVYQSVELGMMMSKNGDLFMVFGAEVGHRASIYRNVNGKPVAVVQMKSSEDIFDMYQRRREFFEESCRLLFGGYVVMALLTMACKIIATLPPYTVN